MSAAYADADEVGSKSKYFGNSNKLRNTKENDSAAFLSHLPSTLE